MLLATKQKTLDEFIFSERQLETALAGLSEEQLDLHAAPGEWSIRQIIHHLVDDGDVWCMLIKRAIVLPGSEVVFGEFPGNEAWAAGMDNHRRGTHAALGLIHAHRVYLAELVDHFDGAWDCTVVIRGAQETKGQPLSVRQMVDILGDHMREHVVSIRSIRAANGV